MNEIKFTPERAREHQEEYEKLKQEGGFLLKEKQDKKYISFLGSRSSIGGTEKDFIVEFETEIQREEELKEILGDIRQTPLFRKILTFIINSYNEQRISLIQSVPGTGKTFTYGKFNELLHGRDARVEYLACTPRTSELDLMGHWAPEGKGAPSKQEVETSLSQDEQWQNFLKGFEKDLIGLVAQKQMLSEQEFQKRWSEIHREYASFQEQRLSSLFKGTEAWVYHKGALLAAYKNPLDPKDQGRFAIIDEIDNLPENYQNIFLQISGSEGKLAQRITTYSDSGETEFIKGKNTFVVFAANYPELALGKRAISAPLADRVDWLAITPLESLEDEKLRIEKYSFVSLKEKFIDADPQVIENLKKILSNTLASIHIAWKKSLSDYRKQGIEVTEDISRIREQEKEFSQRAIIGLENEILNNLDNPNYLDADTGRVNLTELFVDAFNDKYISFLASGKLRLKFQGEQLLPLIYGGQKQLIITSDGKAKIEEIPELQESAFLYVEDGGQFRSYDKDKDKTKFEKGETMVLNQVLDALIKNLYEGEQDKKIVEEEGEEQEKQKREQIKFDAEDALESILKDPLIPESIKELLK